MFDSLTKSSSIMFVFVFALASLSMGLGLVALAGLLWLSAHIPDWVHSMWFILFVVVPAIIASIVCICACGPGITTREAGRVKAR